MNAKQIEERARDIAAAKLAGLIPMTDAEVAAWCEGWKKGADEGALALKAAMDRYRAAQAEAGTFTCAACGGVFPLGDDDAAEAEYTALFPAAKASGEPREVVCDGCWEKVRPRA